MSVSVFPRESLLVFSDVHLGSDVSDRTTLIPHRTREIDRDLLELVAHYRKRASDGARWRIVVAGDFIDFIGIAIGAGDEKLDTEPNEEEREHGIGNAADHSRLKLRRVHARHADFFAELAGFVADGHALTIVHGNHDIEFHWDAVKEDLRGILFEQATRQAAGATLDEAEFRGRIEFNPWFFYRRGLVYIEHGHQYDPYCSTEHVMAPLSPLDPRRIARGMTEILLRYVVRPTRGMSEQGHESTGMLHYVTFALKLGIPGLLRLGMRFASACLELFRLRRAYVSEASQKLRAEHERRVALLAEATRIGHDRLKALLRLQAPPVTRSVRGVLASVLLDRLALALAATLALVVVGIVSVYHGHAALGVFAVLVAWAFFHRKLVGARKVDASEQLASRASELGRLFPAAFVVMGHTHAPVESNLGETTYINLGSWAEEESVDEDEPHARAARTHLVIQYEGDQPHAELMQWQPGTGPRRFIAS
jgi:UDP-2,3-diacylglucosamine pyrophosphatase LpxH